MYTVMIAEDELLVRMGIIASIPWGDLDMCVVADLSDGTLAYEKYLELRPDIVLTDIRMPGMDGLELIKKIREADRACAIIVISCMEDFHTLHAAMEMGVSSYLLKASMTHEDILRSFRQARDSLTNRTQHSASPGPSGVETSLYDYLISGTAPDGRRAPGAFVFRHLLAVYIDGAAGGVLRRYIDKMVTDKLSACSRPISIDDASRIIYLIREDIVTRVGELLPALRRVTRDTLSSLGLRVKMVLLDLNGKLQDMRDALAMANRLQSDAYLCVDSVVWVDARRALRDPKLDACMAGIEDRLLEGEFDERVVSEKSALLDGLRQSSVCSRSAFEEALYRLAAYLSSRDGFDSAQLYILRDCMNNASTLSQALDAFAQMLSAQARREPMRSREVRAAVKYMRDNLEKGVTLQDTAREVSLSSSYFSSLFKRETGVGFTEYMTRLRVARAKKLLEEGDCTVGDIAARCGFSDIAYFSRVFKQATGVSPSRWVNDGNDATI